VSVNFCVVCNEGDAAAVTGMTPVCDNDTRPHRHQGGHCTFASKDRALIRILLAHSSVESTTTAVTGDCSDWFGRWAAPEVSTDSAPATRTTREVVDTATPSLTARQRSNLAVNAISLSYNELKRAGFVNRTTFQYVPNSGAYLASKTRVKLGSKQRRQSGITKLTQRSADATTRLEGSRDDRRQTSAARRTRVDTFSLQQQRSTNLPTSCNDNKNDLVTQQQTGIDLQSHQRESRSDQQVSETADTTRLSSRGRHDGDEATRCSSDVDHTTDQITTGQEQQQQHCDSRQVKTWLYNFLPPIATMTQLGHGDADTSREKHSLHAGARNQRLSHRSRAVGGRIGHQPPAPDTACGRHQRQLTSAASDDTHSHAGHRAAVKQTTLIQVDRQCRRRSESSNIPTDDDDKQLYFTDTCLLPHCDCRHHYQDVYSDHEDEPSLTRKNVENDDDDDDCDDDKTDDNAAAAADDNDDGNNDNEDNEETDKKSYEINVDVVEFKAVEQTEHEAKR